MKKILMILLSAILLTSCSVEQKEVVSGSYNTIVLPKDFLDRADRQGVINNAANLGVEGVWDQGIYTFTLLDTDRTSVSQFQTMAAVILGTFLDEWSFLKSVYINEDISEISFYCEGGDAPSEDINEIISKGKTVATMIQYLDETNRETVKIKITIYDRITKKVLGQENYS